MIFIGSYLPKKILCPEFQRKKNGEGRLWEDVTQTLRTREYRTFNGYGGSKCHFSKQQVKPRIPPLESGLHFATSFGKLNSAISKQGLKSTYNFCSNFLASLPWDCHVKKFAWVTWKMTDHMKNTQLTASTNCQTYEGGHLRLSSSSPRQAQEKNNLAEPILLTYQIESQ